MGSAWLHLESHLLAEQNTDVTKTAVFGSPKLSPDKGLWEKYTSKTLPRMTVFGGACQACWFALVESMTLLSFSPSQLPYASSPEANVCSSAPAQTLHICVTHEPALLYAPHSAVPFFFFPLAQYSITFRANATSLTMIDPHLLHPECKVFDFECGSFCSVNSLWSQAEHLADVKHLVSEVQRSNLESHYRP